MFKCKWHNYVHSELGIGKGKFRAHVTVHAPGCALAGAGQASLSADGCLSAARWPHSVVCRVNGLYRQSQGVASSCHFLLLRLVSSRSQPCTSGANLPAGRVALQPHDCFCFYGASGWGQPGVGTDWKVTPLEGAEGPLGVQSLLFPLIKRYFKRCECFAGFTQSQDHPRKEHSPLCAFQCLSPNSKCADCPKSRNARTSSEKEKFRHV